MRKFVLTEEKEKIPAFYVAAGAAAGFLNGLLGALGGIVLVLALSKKIKEPDVRFATSVAVMTPVTAVAALNYLSSGDAPPYPLLLLPAAIGGALGAALSGKLKGDALTCIFAALTAVAGINMLLG